MNGVNPKGGELIEANIRPLTPEKIEAEVDKIIRAFKTVTRDQARLGLMEAVGSECYVNNIYQVLVYRGVHCDKLIHTDELKGKCTWLSIKRKDKRPVNNWQDMQSIKNRLVGTECDAIQLFPSESRLLNTANQYHLIVFPEGWAFPFGWGKRTVFEEQFPKDGGAVQAFNGDT
tara:strand:- start:112 stop:633 length:522 start_codon:yes stop_codon:yes gene_type:complete